MVSSKPTSHAGVYETTPNPYYPPSSFTAPGSQQPPGSINLENQAQGVQSAQPYFITSPGTSAVSQPGQGNTRMINPSVGAAVINFKEEAKVLGVSLFTTRILNSHLQALLISYRKRQYHPIAKKF